MKHISILSLLSNPPPNCVFNSPSSKFTILTESDCPLPIINLLNNEFYDFCVLLTPFLLNNLPANVRQLTPDIMLDYFNQKSHQHPSMIVMFSAEAFMAHLPFNIQISFLTFVSSISPIFITTVQKQHLSKLKPLAVLDLIQIKSYSQGFKIHFITSNIHSKSLLCTGNFDFCALLQ